MKRDYIWLDQILDWLYIRKKKFKKYLKLKFFPYCKYFLKTYLNFWILPYWKTVFLICLNSFHIIIAIAFILFKNLILYLFIWQLVITIVVVCYELFLYIKINYLQIKQIASKDINYVAYIQFLTKFWYRFSYHLIKYYIKLEKKEKNFFFIFLRWIFLITPFYWGFILFLILIYFSILNCIFLLRIAVKDQKNWIVILIYLIIENFYNIFLLPILNKIEYIVTQVMLFGWLKFLYEIYIEFMNSALIFLQKNYFFIWIRWRRFYKFFRYKFFWLIKRKFLKKNIWIFRYKKFIYFIKWFYKVLNLIKKFKLNLSFNNLKKKIFH